MNKWLMFFAILVSWGCTSSEDYPSPKFATEISHSTEHVGLFGTKVTSYWSEQPTIKICPGAGISVERVRYAVRFWERAGYSFGPIIQAPRGLYRCEAYPGEIVFRLPTQQEIAEAVATNRMGVTKTTFERTTRQTIMSEIYFQTQVASHKEKIVEHELGHALGWQHHNRTSHIMHPNLDLTGRSVIGVERRDYDERISDILAETSGSGRR